MRARRILKAAGALTAAVALLAIASLAWIACTTSGLRAAAHVAQRLVPGLGFDTVDGRLVGPLHIRRLVYATNERRIIVDELQIEWQPSRLLNRTLQVDALRIGRLAVAAGNKTSTPAAAPSDLTLPIAVHVESFRIGGVVFANAAERDAPPQLTGIAGRFMSDGRHHSLEKLRIATAQLGIDADARLDGRAPFAASATATLHGTEGDRPFAVAFDATGRLRDLTLHARSLDDTLNANGVANVDAFAEQPLRYLKLSASGIDPASWRKGAPHAKIAVDAVLESATPTALAWSGFVKLRNENAGPLSDDRLPLRQFDADVHIDGSRIDVPRFSMSFTSGTAAGTAHWANGSLSIASRLSGVDAAAWHARLVATRLDGTIDARIGGAAQQVQATLRDPRFVLRLDATREHDVIRLNTAQFTGRGGRIDAGGKFDPHGAFELAAQLRDVDPAAFANLPHASLNAKVDARGRLGERPAATLQFTLAESQLAGHPFSGSGDVAFAGERLDKAEITLRAGDNRLDVHGSLGRRDDRLTLQIDAPRLEQIGMGGTLTGNAALTGALRSPDIEWKLESPRLVLPDGTLLQTLVSNGHVGTTGTAVANTAGNTIDGTLDARLSVQRFAPASGLPPLADASAELRGTRSAHRLQLAAKVGKEGYAFTAGASGGLGDDRLWHGVIESLQWHGPEALSLHAPTPLTIGRDRVDLANAVIDGRDWQATIAKVAWQPGRLQSAGHFDRLPLAAFVTQADIASTLRLEGEWDVDLWHTAQGHVRVARQEGDVALSTERGALTLGLQRFGIAADIADNTARIALEARADRAGTVDGNLALDLHVSDGAWEIARTAPWHGDIRLDMPSVEWLSPLLGDSVRLNGRLNGAARIGGTPASPAITGQVDGADLRVRMLDQGLDLSGGSLRVDFTPESIRLQRLELISSATQRPKESRIDYARLAATRGNLLLEGEVDTRSGTGSVRLQANHLAVAQLPTRWAMVSGRGELHFAERHLDVKGDLSVDAAYVELAGSNRPTLSDDVVVIGRDRGQPAMRVALDANLDLGRQFYFNGAGLDTRLAGQVRLSAAQRAELRVHGTVRTEDGIFQAYGQELAIERGIVNFQGTADNPGLNIRALRKQLPVEAGVEVTGTARDPQVRLVSEPDVPDSEKISWLVLGRAPDAGTGTQDTSLLLAATMAMQGNSGKSPMQSLSKGLGLDQLSIGSGTLGSQRRFAQSHVAGNFDDDAGTTEQIATIGKRIGDNAVLSYERSIASAESVVSLTVELTRRLSLVGRVGSTNSAGFLYSFAFGRRGK